MTCSSITAKGETILFPLPVAEEDDHTQMSIGGVFVLLLCSSPGVRARCGLFPAIVLLHSTASWLTDWLAYCWFKKTQQIEWVCFYCWSLSIVVSSGFAHSLRWLKIETGWISVNSSGKMVEVCVCVSGVWGLSYYRCFCGRDITISDTITTPTDTSYNLITVGFKSKYCMCYSDQKESSQTE